MTAVREPREANRGFVIGALVVLAMAVMWIYAFFLAPSGNPDRLEDASFEVAARVVCAETRELLAALPQAADASSALERADPLDAATDALVAQIASLRELRAGTEKDLFLIDAFLADWDIYIEDRYRHADRLRTEENPRFNVTVLEGRTQGIDENLNGFTRVNDIEDCAPPGDIA